MRGNLFFVELGSMATKVMDSETGALEIIPHEYIIIDSNGKIKPAKYINKVIKPLQDFLKGKAKKDSKIFAVATGIFRNPENANVLRILKNMEIFDDLSILTVDEEVMYSFRSYFHNNQPSINEYIYIDMGGGSTEIAHMVGNEINDDNVISLRLGVLHLLSKFFSCSSRNEAMIYLNSYIENNLNENKAQIDKFKERGLNVKCLTLITGSVVKEIKSSYFQGNTLYRSSFREYLDELRTKVFKFEIDFKKEYLPNDEVTETLKKYLGGESLYLLLESMECDKFQINSYGLHHSIKQYFSEKSQM